MKGPRVASILCVSASFATLLASGCMLQVTRPESPGAAKSGSMPTRGGGGGGGVPPPATSPLVITTTTMPNGNVGTRYANFITSSGGSGSPDLFRVVSGRLPNGLSMASSFGVQSTVVSGTPTTLGTSSFIVQVQDQTGHTATQALSITIDPPRPLVISNQAPALAPATVGSAYGASLFADGGTQPYTWAIVAGALPPGLRLSGNVISGTPTTAGTFTFTARVSDNSGQQASMVLSITVSRPV